MRMSLLTWSVLDWEVEPDKERVEEMKQLLKKRNCDEKYKKIIILKEGRKEISKKEKWKRKKRKEKKRYDSKT